VLYSRPVQSLLSNCLALLLPALSQKLPYSEIPRFIKEVSWKSLAEQKEKKNNHKSGSGTPGTLLDHSLPWNISLVVTVLQKIV